MANTFWLERRIERLEKILLQLADEINYFEDPRGYQIADTIYRAVHDHPLDVDSDEFWNDSVNRV